MSEEKIPPRLVTADPQSAGMQALVRMLRLLFFCLRILIVLVFAYLLFSGIFRVDEQNEAMLFRFGALQSRVIDPERGESRVMTSGRWYWAWPYPIDRVKMIPAQKSVNVSTDNIFRPWINPATGQGAEGSNVLRPGADGYLLTGDTNIVHARWEVSYRVTDASNYYLNFYDDSESPDGLDGKKAPLRGAEAIIRSLLANAVLMETATWKVEDLLATTKSCEDAHDHGSGDDGHGHDHGVPHTDKITECVQARLTQMLDEIGMGVQIQSVNLVELQPPAATAEAFREVNASSERGRAEILAARTYRDKAILEAEGRKYHIINEARSYQTRVIETVKADSSYFKTVLAEYEKNPGTMLTALYTDTMRQVLSQVPNKYVVHTLPGGRQELRLQLGPVPEKNRQSQSAQIQE